MNIDTAITRCIKKAQNMRAVTTARSYGTALNAFKKYLIANDVDPKTCSVDDLDMDTFIFYQSWLSQQGYSKSTAGVYIYGVQYFLEWLVIDGHITPDYQQTLRYRDSINQIQRQKEKKLPRWPKQDDVDKMLQAARDRTGVDSPIYDRDIAVIEALASSGARVSELAGLSIKDIDTEDMSAIVMGKGKVQRRTYFNRSTIKALKEYWTVRGSCHPNDPIFARHDRKAGKKKIKFLGVRSIQNIVDSVCDTAGIDRGKFSPHYFRHGFGIRALRETGNLALVQDLMGHASPQATRIYAKIYPDDLRDAYRKIFDKDKNTDNPDNLRDVG